MNRSSAGKIYLTAKRIPVQLVSQRIQVLVSERGCLRIEEIIFFVQVSIQIERRSRHLHTFLQLIDLELMLTLWILSVLLYLFFLINASAVLQFFEEFRCFACRI